MRVFLTPTIHRNATTMMEEFSWSRLCRRPDLLALGSNDQRAHLIVEADMAAPNVAISVRSLGCLCRGDYALGMRTVDPFLASAGLDAA